jgi:hydrogenase-1 operon protein HyaE
MSTIPMPVPAGADVAASYPAIARLFGAHGCAQLQAGDIDSFAAPANHALLVFLEDPMRIKETLDLAVIAPELARAFPGRFTVGVLLPEAARQAQARYGFHRWPALVVLKGGRYVGAIDGLRDWDVYLDQLEALLAAEPTRPPSVGIAVRSADERAGGCAA